MTDGTAVLIAKQDSTALNAIQVRFLFIATQKNNKSLNISITFCLHLFCFGENLKKKYVQRVIII